MQLISRKAANALGRKWYFTGRLCPNGHLSQKAVSNRACERCLQDRKKTKKYKEQQLEYKRSPDGKISNKKYAQSEKGKVATHRSNMKKHESKLDWQKSPKGRNTRNSYEQMRLGLPRQSPIPYPEDGLCQICGNLNNIGQKLFRDHDHKTMKDRGWLCHKCNTGIGGLCDSIEILEKAISYLKKA